MSCDVIFNAQNIGPTGYGITEGSNQQKWRLMNDDLINHLINSAIDQRFRRGSVPVRSLRVQGPGSGVQVRGPGSGEVCREPPEQQRRRAPGSLRPEFAEFVQRRRAEGGERSGKARPQPPAGRSSVLGSVSLLLPLPPSARFRFGPTS